MLEKMDNPVAATSCGYVQGSQVPSSNAGCIDVGHMHKKKLDEVVVAGTGCSNYCGSIIAPSGIYIGTVLNEKTNHVSVMPG
jgi:hypothetical protein